MLAVRAAGAHMLVPRTGSDYEETTCLPQDSIDPEARAAEVEQQREDYQWSTDVSGHETRFDCKRGKLFVRYLSTILLSYTSLVL